MEILITSNLLYNIEEIDASEFDKISLIEQVSAKKIIQRMIYFLCIKDFNNINQFLNVSESYKALSKVEARVSLSKSSFGVRY